MFDSNAPWLEDSSDPSVSLSTFSFERMNNQNFERNTKLFPNTTVKSVTKENEVFVLKTQDGQVFTSSNQPLLAGDSREVTNLSHIFSNREKMDSLL